MEKLHLESIIKSGDFKGMTVLSLVERSGAIFSLIKEGYEFDDDVLLAAHITKTIRDVKFEHQFVEHETPKLKPLPTDTASVKEILRELNTITAQAENFTEKGDSEKNKEEEDDSIYSSTFDINDDGEIEYK